MKTKFTLGRWFKHLLCGLPIILAPLFARLIYGPELKQIIIPVVFALYIAWLYDKRWQEQTDFGD